jgi:heme/copper-type cytochrome/quinol oxidase subunit 4
LKSQEWWLPVLLAVIAIIAVIQLVFRQSVEAWPWYLVSFCHGFNIISRLMMLMPHATRNESGVQVFNTAYVVLMAASVMLSALVLWYVELPDVRQGLLRE